MLALVCAPPARFGAVDTSAGNGIWTRTRATRGLGSVLAVEPSDDMRVQGVETSHAAGMRGLNGSALDFAARHVPGVDLIEATYLTRAWVARSNR